MEAREGKRVKRSQRDYGMAFKLSVISQVEKGEMTYKEAQKRYGIQGKSTVLVWLRKHGSLDWSRAEVHGMRSKEKETPQQQIRRLERELSDERLKNEILNEMVDVMDRDYGAGLRKKYLEGRSVEDSVKKEEA
jgi:transposase-like protein